MRGSGNLLESRFTLGTRYIPGGVLDRAKLRTTLMFRLLPDLQAGAEFNPLADEVGPLVNYRVFRETVGRPALSLGTSSDRIGTPRGQAYYASFSKDLERLTHLPASVYAGPLFGTWDQEIVFPFGLNYRLGSRWVLNPQFDGHAAHGLLSYTWDRYTLSGVLVRWRHPGVALSVGF